MFNLALKMNLNKAETYFIKGKNFRMEIHYKN